MVVIVKIISFIGLCCYAINGVYIINRLIHGPGDLKRRKRTGTSCQIEIHFSIKTTEYLLKYTLFRFQIYVRAIVLITKHD